MQFLFQRDGKSSTELSRLEFGDLTVDVTRKKVKNLRLSVHSPDARVRVSAPYSVSLDMIRSFVASRLDWILKHQSRIRALPREPEYQYLDGEQHYFAGRGYPLTIIESSSRHGVQLDEGRILLRVRPGSTCDKRQSMIYQWYRAQMKQVLPEIIKKYESRMGVNVAEFGVKRMKTRWGTCNILARRIWLNLELARRPRGILEYVVVHEMVHLLERSHNARFSRLMDEYMPDWREHRTTLNGQK